MKIYIQKPYISDFDGVKIFVIDGEGTSRSQITISRTDKTLLEQKRLDPNEPQIVEPFLTLPTEFFNELVKSLSTYASENNIKTENENLLQGKLGSTEKHLEDMRRIVFKDYDKPTS